MSSWNGMKIDLSGSKAKITPAPMTQPRDIGTMQMARIIKEEPCNTLKS